MTIELLCYILLILTAVLLAVVNPNSKKVNYSIMFLLLAYSVIVRFSGFQVDMIGYAESLKYTKELSFANIYFLKEWFYWHLSSFLYTIVPIEELVFIFYDILSFILVYKVIRRYKLPIYTLVLYFLFFPSVMGMQNVFRQFIATAILLYSIHCFKKTRSLNKYLFFVLSGFTHNLAFLFSPVLFMREKQTLLIFSSILVFVLLPFASESKSSSSTGENLTIYYLIVEFIILLYFIISNKFILRGIMKASYYLTLYVFVLTLFSIKILESAQAERISMVGFQLIFPSIFYVLERKFKHLILVRVVAIIIIVLPTFVFPNAFMFLTN